MKQIINLEFLRSKIPEMLFYLYLCDFSSSSSGKNHISGGSHFELSNMAAPLRIGFGSRKIWTEHIKNYHCTNFHAFVQICTFPHENPPNCPNYMCICQVQQSTLYTTRCTLAVGHCGCSRCVYYIIMTG